MQIRPWHIADSHYSTSLYGPADPRKSVFVGGVPRPLKAFELAKVMTERYGHVSFIEIECDPEMKYPKGKPVDNGLDNS